MNDDMYTFKEIIDEIKDKSEEFNNIFSVFILEENDKSKILSGYSISTYIKTFENLFLNNKKPTLNSINKVIKSISNLLVPYNIDLEEYLVKLNYVAKGEPFLEKINGIKLYDIYRKRLSSSIPECMGSYNNLEYGLVSLHDKEIISNGIVSYLLPNNTIASSCLTPNGKAKTCLEHGATNPNGRFFKITNNGKIVAYSWVWRCGDVLCFDNIELTTESKNITNSDKVIYEIYSKAAEEIIKATAKESKKGIKLVLIGRNPIDIKNRFIDTLPAVNDYADTLFKPSSKEELYLKDSREKQVILYGKYSEELDTTDVEPIYMYEREKVEEFKDWDKEYLSKKLNSIYYEYCLQHSKKYKEMDTDYESGFIGEDWFIGNKQDGTYDFYYCENDKRLFTEAKKYLKSIKETKYIIPKIYIPKYKIENILNMNNLNVNMSEIKDYLDSLNTNDYKISDTYFSHTTNSLKTLSQVFSDGAITSSNYGNHSGGEGTNCTHYICIAKVGSDIHESYKKTGTIIIDNNMEIFAEKIYITWKYKGGI